MRHICSTMLLIALASAPALGQKVHAPWPQSDPQDWITIADYPEKEAKGDRSATDYVLQIDQTGAVTSCHASDGLEISPDPAGIYSEFPKLTCRILQQRAKFVPAVDSSGNASSGTYSGRVVWSKDADRDGHMELVFRSNPPPIAPPMVLPPPPQAQPPTAPAPKSKYGSQIARPIGNPSIWITQADYPTRAMREKREGTVTFKIIVLADGRPGACSIANSSGHPDLDAVTCMIIMRRARFEQVDDGAQTIINRNYSGRIRWKVPYTGEPQKPLPAK